MQPPGIATAELSGVAVAVGALDSGRTFAVLFCDDRDIVGHTRREILDDVVADPAFIHGLPIGELGGVGSLPAELVGDIVDADLIVGAGRESDEQAADAVGRGGDVGRGRGRIVVVGVGRGEGQSGQRGEEGQQGQNQAGTDEDMPTPPPPI